MATKVTNGLDLQSQRIVAVASPSSGTDAVNRDYVDNLLLGLRWKAPVRVATTTNGTLATAYANGQTVDGVSLATGDRILLKNQTTGADNGIYVVAASGAPARATDADSTAELHGAAVLVTAGSTQADKAFVQTADNPTVNTTSLVWSQFGGGASYTFDGDGIQESGGTVSLELDGTTLSKSSSGVRIGSGAAGAGLVDSSGVLAVGAGTGITVNANDVAIDTSIVPRKYSTTIGDNSATTFTVTHSLGTRDVQVVVYEAGDDYEVVWADVKHATTTTVTVIFAVAPTTSQYRVVVVG